MKGLRLIILSFLMAVLAPACGDSGGGGSNQGRFLDSPVEGLEYVSGGESGITDDQGTFRMGGNSVQFSVGDIIIGEGTATSIMTPVDLVPGATDETDPTVTNIARFLLTLDDDGNPDNGITIREEVRNGAVGKSIDFSQSVTSFTNGSNVQSAVADLTSLTSAGARTLISTQQAQTHLGNTLLELQEPIEPPGGGSSCELVTQGESFLKVTNNLSTGLEVFFEQFAFGALMRPGVCEIFGMPSGSVKVELTQCTFASDSECALFGSTITKLFSIGKGETQDLVVTADTF